MEVQFQPSTVDADTARRVDGAVRVGPSQGEVGNQLLRLMDPSDYQLLRPHLERVPIEIGATLATVGEPIDTVWFLEAAVAGFLDVLSDGRRLTVGLVGREGCLGWPMLLGHDYWPYDVSVRAEEGTALRIEASRLAAIN